MVTDPADEARQSGCECELQLRVVAMSRFAQILNLFWYVLGLELPGPRGGARLGLSPELPVAAKSRCEALAGGEAGYGGLPCVTRCLCSLVVVCLGCLTLLDPCGGSH